LAPPSKFENKEKEASIRQWLPDLELYLANIPNANYLQFAASYLGGKPRVYWGAQFEAWQRANPDVAVPADARQFFRDTMIRGYGIRDPVQSYWDTWNKLRQGPGQSIDEFNIVFTQAMTDLGARLTDEDVKIEHYRQALQTDLREMCRVNPNGGRWATLDELVTYATLQWPTIEARLAKRRVSQPTRSVAGKRKMSGGSPAKSSKARVGVALSPEEYAHNMENRLCHKCKKSGHIAKDCPGESQNKTSNKKVKTSQNKPKEKSSADF
jgi:hypothetical protein